MVIVITSNDSRNKLQDCWADKEERSRNQGNREFTNSAPPAKDEVEDAVGVSEVVVRSANSSCQHVGESLSFQLFIKVDIFIGDCRQ
jgi:hypothetical protein